jgi:hypothetical protein
MKKILLFVGVILIICIFYIYYPRRIDLDTQGLKYRLGDGSAGNEQLINIYIKGKMYRGLTGNKTFKGIIDFEDDGIPVPKVHRQLEINFFRGYAGVIAYQYNQDGKPVIFTIGSIYTNKNFNKISIAVLDHEGSGGSWTSEDGIMITAPASSRSEAIDISNKLMKDYLNGYKMK